MNLPLFIAWRYLFAKKSHNVINVISMVSATGLAIGTAALILILSVYNGFNEVVDSNLGTFDPDIRICRQDYGFFNPDEIESCGDIFGDTVFSHCRVLEFDGFMTYGNEQSAVHILGTDGDLSLKRGDIRQAAVGAGISGRMGINPNFLDPIRLFSPDRSAKISLANPSSSILSTEVYPNRIFSVNKEIDDNYIIIPLESARSIFGVDSLCSSIDLKLMDGGPKSVKDVINRTKMPEGFVMQDRRAQHPELYRMMELEKAAVFLILLIVVMIVALNISGSLSMLKIEKEYDMGALRAMGAKEPDIRRVFLYEGCLISLAGMFAGLLVGIALALLQQHFGFVKLPGNLLVDAYPVVLTAKDVIASAAGVSFIGFGIATISSRSSLH